MRVAGGIVPAQFRDPRRGSRRRAVSRWTISPPDTHPVWKDLLQAGNIDAATAAAVGDVLGRIHAATADRPDIAARFPTDDIFHPIRLEPYLLATARAHPDSRRAPPARRNDAQPKLALVHGDFSPKNILIGPAGPVILDAECAWYGDPAFDLAFCLNHLLLKCLWRRSGARDSSPLRRLGRGLPRARHLGAARELRARGRRRCCPACCSRASMASRRSSI